MKYLITGVNGQLGYDIWQELKKRNELDVLAPGKDKLDITNKEQVMKVVGTYQPDVIIHCAAYTAVDKAEIERDKAKLVNIVGTKNMVDASLAVDAKFMFMSTDYVFDGTKQGKYLEEDKPHPQSIYGFTKYIGEELVKENPKHFITRISWVFGINGHNFIKTMLNLSQTHHELNVVNDQIGSPTYTVDLAKLLIDMAQTDAYGTYHVTNQGYCSWAQLAQYVFDSNGVDTIVHPLPTKEYLQITGTKQAVRPKNSKLDKTKLMSAGFTMLPDWTDAVDRYSKQLIKKRG